MPTRPLGTSEVAATTVIFGTWQAGKRGWDNIDDAESIAAMRAALAAGVTTFDTAEIYGDGHSERVVAQALASDRDRVQLLTKVFPNHLRHDDVLAACDRSLRNLQTEVIDLYQIHWPAGSFGTEAVPIGETMAALNLLKEQGKIRAIGVSNFSLAQLQEAERYGRIDTVQPPYSLFWRQVEKELIPYCGERQISVLAYSPLAQGLLAGRYRGGDRPAATEFRAKHRLFAPEPYARVQRALDGLEPIAQNLGLSVGNMALAWLVAAGRLRASVHAIVGARTAAQAIENAQAASVTLTAETLAAIESLGRIVTDGLGDDPLAWDL
ncbi:MAG TPA: aldo/keto reductase [Cyanobacteria bacterium UBA8156]|nr:aldo/keto reductase [Cyanobacteria bacterium UBA8156]